MRLRTRSSLVLICAIAAVGGARAQAPACGALEQLAASTYHFRPTDLSNPQQQSKSRQLDNFWSAAKAAGAPGVSCLEQMLDANQADGFFAYDGASLLLSLDQRKSAQETAARSLAHADLGQVQITAFLSLSMYLAHEGIDIGAIGRNYLESSDVVAYLPEHAMKVDRGLGAIFLFGSMDPNVADSYLVRELDSPKLDTRAAAAVALGLCFTARSFQALHGSRSLQALPPQAKASIDSVMVRKAWQAAALPSFTREQVLAAFAKLGDPGGSATNTEELDTSAEAVLTAADLDAVARARTRSMRLSDEGMDDYMALSKVMLGLINRFDLFAGWRDRAK